MVATGCVFNIERFAVHDGPGIRDLVFTKGCPLRCKWCSNPESQNPYPEISFSEERCIGFAECGDCEAVCPEMAISETEAGKIKIDRNKCSNCGICVDTCPSKAIRLIGEYLSVDSIMETIEKDCAFFQGLGEG